MNRLLTLTQSSEVPPPISSSVIATSDAPVDARASRAAWHPEVGNPPALSFTVSILDARRSRRYLTHNEIENLKRS